MSRSRSLILLFSTAVVLAASLAGATAASASFGYVNGLNMHGEGASGDLLQWDAMRGLARASNGDMFVIDDGVDRIVKLDSTGAFVLEWGDSGTGDNQFTTANAIGVGPIDGNVYVVDGGGIPCVRVFSPSGTFLRRWGSSGTDNGKFNSPSGIGFDASGNVYVSDSGNHRVQYFDSTGSWLGNFGDPSGPGQLAAPRGVAVDADGTVFVVDGGYLAPSYHGRIAVFNGAGSGSPFTYARQIGAYGTNPGLFSSPMGVAIQPGSPSQVYATDTFASHRIQRFNSATGALLSRWGYDYPDGEGGPGSGWGSAPGKFNGPMQIALDGSNNAWVADAGNHRVDLFSNANSDTTPTFLGSWGTDGSGPGQFVWPSAVATAPDGTSYVAESTFEHARIQHVDGNGQVLHSFGEFGSGDGQIKDVYGMSVGPDGDLWVADSVNSRVQRFSAAGEFKEKITSINGASIYPMDVVVAADGTLYVADFDNRRIAVISGDGQTESQWGANGYGEENADFLGITGLALSPDDAHIYVLDSWANRVKKLSTAGVFEAKSADYNGSGGSGDGQLKNPSGIDVDPTTGEVLVADTTNERVQRFSPGLEFVSKFGAHGRGTGEFQSPVGVSIDPHGFTWVSDRLSNRVQRFGDGANVTITSPALTGTTTTADSIAITYTKNDAVATCNVPSGASHPLAVGLNELTITCTNSRGEHSVVVTVTRTLPPSPTPPGVNNPGGSPSGVFELTLAKKLKLSTKLKFSVTCDVGCTVGATLKIASTAIKLKPAALAGQQAAQRVTMKLSKSQVKRAKAALAKKKKVTLTVTVIPPAGYKATQGKSGKASVAK